MPIIYDDEGKAPLVIDITLYNKLTSHLDMVKKTIETDKRYARIWDFGELLK